jgi:glyoxylate utilization-related uncharacterized protein
LAKPGDELVNPVSGQGIAFRSITPELLEVETWYRAGGPAAPPHLHPAQDERFEVLSGEVRAVIAGEERTLRRGDVLDVPAGTPHEFGGHAGTDGRARWQTRPALRTAEFMETTFGLARDGRVNPRTGVPGLLQMALTLREFDAEFRLVKPPRPLQLVLFSILGAVGRLRGLRPTYAGALSSERHR